MSQPMHTSLSSYQSRAITFIHKLQRFGRRALQPTPIARILRQVEGAKTPFQLERSINAFQTRIWDLPLKEQRRLRDRLTTILSKRVLGDAALAIRLEAASWLRMLIQAGLLLQPAEVFVTLVTAATQVDTRDEQGLREQQDYLKLLFECFWPFHFPYPAFSWEQFPTNATFYPLAALLKQGDRQTQDALISIFSEVNTLDDPEIASSLLPVALTWANQSDPEQRRRITNILARISHPDSQEALQRLQRDADPVVRASAKHAANFVRYA